MNIISQIKIVVATYSTFNFGLLSGDMLGFRKTWSETVSCMCWRNLLGQQLRTPVHGWIHLFPAQSKRENHSNQKLCPWKSSVCYFYITHGWQKLCAQMFLSGLVLLKKFVRQFNFYILCCRLMVDSGLLSTNWWVYGFFKTKSCDCLACFCWNRLESISLLLRFMTSIPHEITPQCHYQKPPKT